MTQFEYKEEIMSMKVSLLDQINEQGRYGWEFVIQAQRITQNRLDISGQQKTEIVLIFKRQIQTPEVIKN